ncbi:hypothetical protein L21SP3_00384 [Sedimentisphaera cyanobacteriorum]|uniref:Laminin G domain-containing protein n=1 Tax=Sedimentisphaera cyanobacteriorum TaxID=1940790 RepID=A0A1Q2HMA0_9BACT|nr:LamG-like jellyroll fold domain-containing protein [Sedimentisphaera cyanobacteriorum]AQQ08597.1 hypothetical protein L21SP3_00384 [Sedimentisphaera cyanobacteriorum]
MRKVLIVLMCFGCIYAAKGADLLENWQFDDGLDGWEHTSNNKWHHHLETEMEGDEEINYFRYGWADGLMIWQNMGTFEENTKYRMKVTAKNWDGKCEAVRLIFKDQTTGIHVVDDEKWFEYGGDNTWPDPNAVYPWEEFSTELDTSNHPEIVGNSMLTVIRLSDYEDPWGQWCWLALDSVSVVPDKPKVMEQPVDDIASPDAEFSVGVASYSQVHYQWYISDDDAVGNDVPVGTDSETLVLTDVPSGDAGKKIYCVVTNDETTASDTSEMALLGVEAKMAHWKFEDNLEDDTVNGYDGTLYAPYSPSFTMDGYDGSAIEFTQTEPNRVVIEGSEDDFNNYQGGLTVSAWVNTEYTDGWQVITAKDDRDIDWSGWYLGISDSQQAAFTFRGADNSTGSTELADGQWHMITVTYNSETMEQRLYVDGLQDAPTVVLDSAPAKTPAGEVPVVIGAENMYSDGPRNPFYGLMDDVRIYNYPKDPYQVIDIYNDVTDPDKIFCIEDDIPALDTTGPDGQPDCKVDLLDFAALSADWMSSGLYPAD